MRTSPMSPLRVALLSTCVVGAAAVVRADGPVVVPDDRSVDFSVDALVPAEPAGAEVAQTVGHDTPLGEPRRAAETPGHPDDATPDRTAVRDPRRNEFVRVGMALVVVLGIMVVLRLAVRRYGGALSGGGRPSGVLEVLGRYPIGRGQQLVLLKLVGRIVLLHQGRHGVAALSEITEPDEVAALLARVEASRRSTTTDFGAELSAAGNVVVDLTKRPRRALAQGAGS